MIDVGDLPLPPEPDRSEQRRDSFVHPVGYRFAFVGVGQAGGRIAHTFHELGYGRVCAVNTTIADLSELKLPDAHKLDIGKAMGAGKDPEHAAAVIADKDEDVFDLLKRSWGDDVDYGFVCLAAAGGTGAGCATKVVEVARRYMAETKRPVKVGVIVALPKDSESDRHAKNTLFTLRQLAKLKLSPIIFIDNERYKQIYGKAISGLAEKPMSNKSTAQILHALNRMAGTDSTNLGGTTFDRAEFAMLLDSGIVAFATQEIKQWGSPADISTPIRDQLKNNVLAAVDLTRGTVGALIYVLSGITQEQVKVTDLDHGSEMFNRILAKGSTVFTGVYPGTGGDVLKLLAMVGGLPWPKTRIDQLAATAGERREGVAEEFGVG